MEVQEPLRFDCEHRQVLLEAFKDAVEPYLHGCDEHAFWQGQPPYIYFRSNEDGNVVSQKTQPELKNDFVYTASKRLNDPSFKQKQAERQRKSEHQYERAQ